MFVFALRYVCLFLLLLLWLFVYLLIVFVSCVCLRVCFYMRFVYVLESVCVYYTLLFTHDIVYINSPICFHFVFHHLLSYSSTLTHSYSIHEPYSLPPFPHFPPSVPVDGECRGEAAVTACDSTGRQYSSLCSLVRAGATLAYLGPCSVSNCDDVVVVVL